MIDEKVKEQCILLKNRINTLIEHYDIYREVMNQIKDQHPEYLQDYIIPGNMVETLGKIPNELAVLMNYTTSATTIYLGLVNRYEDLKDKYPEYIRTNGILKNIAQN